MRGLSTLLGLLWLGAIASAQQPTVFFGARFTTQVRADERTTRLRWYDDLGRHSVVFLQLYHDAGYAGYIAQRLQNLPKERNRTALDEAYIERLEGWRVGKFYAPFGAGTLLNESVFAVQSPTRFAIGNLPMRVAYVFNGEDRQQGFLARVGSANGGVSVGIGRHFGTDPHAFTVWRLPESPLVSPGYDTLYGADWRPPVLNRELQMEWLYTEGRQMPDTHWLGLYWQSRRGRYEPAVWLAYQSADSVLSWRVSLQDRRGTPFQLGMSLRGREGTIQFIALELRGSL